MTGLPGVELRTSDPIWTAAYTPYWEKIGEIVAKYQISKGGPIIAVQIENGESYIASSQPTSLADVEPEYYLDGSDSGALDLPYVQRLENILRSSGVVIPFSFNDVRPAISLLDGRQADPTRTSKVPD